jgi:tetratricopeptide (TPR) repeat protein/transcriptional regulator with XRE-family HTH domain
MKMRPNGQKTRELREKRGWSQEDLAAKTGVVLNTIVRAEKSLRMRGDNVSCIAEALGVPVQELWLPAPKVFIGDLPTPLSSGRFFGRQHELKELDAAWEADACRVVTVVGGWGAGKSALISEWLKRMQEDDYRAAVWVVGWSFRGQGSTDYGGGDNFFHHALTCFGDPNPDVGLEQEKAIRLRARIGDHRTLLVLDGLEPLQSRPTEWGEGGRITDENEAMRRLIRHLATQLNGLCVITSRFSVLDLSDLTAGGRAGSVWDIRLPSLDLRPATELLKSRNLHGPEEQFINAVQDYQGHPLSLTVLASVLLRRYGGDIARWREVVPSGGPIDEILASLERQLSGEEKAVMRLMGLFDGPAEAKAIQALRAGTPIPGLTDVLKRLDESGWAAVLRNVRDLQLLAEENDKRPLDLDCHPAVRAYFAKRLEQEQPKARREGHFRLYQHFKKEENLGVIDNHYQAIRHGCQAGRHAEVFDELVWDKMCAGFALRRLNAHGAGARDEIVLKYFVPDPFDSEPKCLAEGFDGERKGRLLLWAAVVLHVRGRVPAAVKFAELAREVFGATQSGEHGLSFWCSSAYLSWFRAASGNLDEAVKLSKGCIRGAELDLQGEPLWKKIALCLHACIVSYMGKFDEALEHYERAAAMKRDMPGSFDVALALLRFHYGCLLLKRKRFDDAKREADNLLKACQDNPVLGFLGYLLLARMELARASEPLGDAEKYLAQGKEYLNLGPAHDQFVVSELCIAQCNRIRGNLQEAESHLRQAEEAAEAFVLLKMDCLLERAWLCLDQGDREKARKTCKSVRDLVNDHNYLCIDKELRELEDVLQKA